MKQKVMLLTAMLLTSDLWAMASKPSDPNAPPPPAWAQWFPIIMMIGVFYFLLIRPQSKQRKEREALLSNLKKGDKIVTQGGFIATIVNVLPDHLEIKLNEETKVKIQRSGVADVYKEPAAVVPEVVQK
jgi:preprotein translocase subunit YajC